MGQLIGDAFWFARSGLNTNLLGWRGSEKFALSCAINKINVTTVVVLKKKKKKLRMCFLFNMPDWSRTLDVEKTCSSWKQGCDSEEGLGVFRLIFRFSAQLWTYGAIGEISSRSKGENKNLKKQKKEGCEAATLWIERRERLDSRLPTSEHTSATRLALNRGTLGAADFGYPLRLKTHLCSRRQSSELWLLLLSTLLHF